MEQVTLEEFKASCPIILEKVKNSGCPLVVIGNGEPLALISPPPLRGEKKDWLGSLRDIVEIRGDVISPVSDEKEWEALET